MSTLSNILPEPPDGTMVVLMEGERDRRLIWRDDKEACEWWAEANTQRWYDETSGIDGDPMTWETQLFGATAVYVVPSEPTAVAPEQDTRRV